MKLTIYKKMMIGFSIIIIIMIISSAYILIELNAISKAAKVTLNSNVQAVELARQLQEILHDENGDAQKYIISRDETYFSLFKATTQRFDQYLNLLLQAQTSDSERTLIRNMRRTHESFVAGIEHMKNHQEKDKVQTPVNLGSDDMKTLNRSLDRLISTNQFSIRKAISEIETTTTRSVKVSLMLIIGTLLAAISLALSITRTITRPIGNLIRGTEQIARGKFKKIDITSNDEIALLVDAVNEMGDKIKKINEIRTQMMQQISHELQTPLQVMLSAHDILKSEDLGSLNNEQIKRLDTIREGIRKLSSFSKQYLDLAKIDSGMMKYTMEWTDLLQIVEPIVDDAKLIAAPKNISVKLNYLTTPKVKVDSNKISIVVSNLLTNAIKNTRNDGKIGVKIAPCTLGVKVEVQDSGIGIPPEELPKIFTKFYQAGNTDKIRRNGTGVGLALVKAFIEGHGGKVYAESTVDIGSTFTVELPAVSA